MGGQGVARIREGRVMKEDTLKTVFSGLPKQATHIAMDEDGEWYWFNATPEPDINFNVWCLPPGSAGRFGLVEPPPPPVPYWLESKHARPA